jgi:hypothetical protein
MWDLFRKTWVEKYIFVSMKHKGFNLNVMIIILKSILNCETLGWKKISNGIVLDNIFLKPICI